MKQNVILNSENDIRKTNIQSANEIKKVVEVVKNKLAVAEKTMMYLHPKFDEVITESFEKKLFDKNNIISRKAYRKLSKRAADDIAKTVIKECECHNIVDKAVIADSLVTTINETQEMIKSFTDELSNRITFHNAIAAACEFAFKSKIKNETFLKIVLEPVIMTLIDTATVSEERKNDDACKKMLSNKIISMFEPVIEEFVDSILFTYDLDINVDEYRCRNIL